MKNTLLTTTALALTGFAGAANAVEVTAGTLNPEISSSYADILSYTSVNTDGKGAKSDSLDVLTNKKIYFEPSITLGNKEADGIFEYKSTASPNWWIGLDPKPENFIYPEEGLLIGEARRRPFDR